VFSRGAIDAERIFRQIGHLLSPIFTFGILGLMVCRIWAHYSFSIFDDAFITFRYARNLCSGEGLVYNSGEWVLGTTAPLYSLILSLMCMAGIPIEYSSTALGLISDVVVGILAFSAISHSFSLRAGVIFLLLFALSPTLNRIGASGMESSLFLMALIVAVLSYTRGHTIVAVLIGTIAYFLRPEGVLLLLLFGLAELTKGRLWKALTLAAVSLAVAVPALLLINVFYGSILPQSVTAKATMVNGTLYAVAQTLFWSDRFTMLILPFAVVGVVPCLRRPGFARFLLLFAGAYAVAYFGGRPYMWPWYGTPTIFAIMIAAGVGADTILRRVPRLGRWVNSARIQFAAPVLIVILLTLTHYMHSGNDVNRNVYAPLADWCAHNFSPRSDVLAADIGAVGYFCGGRVLDSAALVWPEAMRYSSDLEIVKEKRPEFIFLNVTEGDRNLLSSLDSVQNYEIVRRFSSRGLQETDPAKIDWSKSWVQDYLMLRVSQ
jgi:arabinofuranosyltransferase